MKEGGNGKNLGSIMIPKARGVGKSLFRASTPKKTEGMSVSLHCIEQVVHYRFFSCFRLRPGHKNSLEDKTYVTYPTMDFPVHGEPDGVSCILVEDCTCKL